MLLIAPLRPCYEVWPNEVKKWKDFKDLKVIVLHGNKKDKLLKEDADIYVINPEGLEWLTQVKKTKVGKKFRVDINLRRFKEFGFDTLLIDELSKFKHQSSSRFKIIKLIANTFSRRWGLTGSPAANGLMDLFGQCYILDGGARLGRFITHYRQKYFEQQPGNYYKWVLKKNSERRIYRRLKPLALRIRENELDMPSLVENKIIVDLPKEALKLHDELKQNLFTMIGDEVVTAGTAAVASGKCRQVAGGAVFLSPEIEALVRVANKEKEWVQVHTAKIDALSDLIDELQGSPLFIGYEFDHELERFKKKFGEDIPFLKGGMTAAKFKTVSDAWNEGKLPYLFCQTQAVSHGLNLQESSGQHVALYTIPWDFDVLDQFIRRVRRSGNKAEKVFLHYFIARKTIDEYVYWLIKNKDRTQNKVFDALLKMHKDWLES